MTGLDRRALLERGARLAAAGALLPSLRLLELPADAAVDPRLRELDRLLQGPVLRPSSAGYATAKQVYNARFNGVSPLAVARVAGPRDVSRAIGWARKHGVRITARSGGHSYAGYSIGSGLVVDLRRLNAVHVDASAKTATIGAGALLGDVYTALWQRRVTIPAGSCPTVGIGGLAQGGGVGLSSRRFGTTCDNMLAATVVTADGAILTCSPHAHADLFWAIRGGGGGNFGVATSFTFRVHPVDSVTTFFVQWPWSSVRAVVKAWQTWAPHAPDKLFSVCGLSATSGGGTPRITASGQFFGSKAALSTLLRPLLAAATPSSTSLVTRSYIDAVTYFSGGCHGPARACWSPQPFAAKSDYARRSLSSAAVEALVRGIEARQASSQPGSGYVLLDSYGGAINRIPPGATAFVHRDCLFSFQYQSVWPAGTKADASIAWLRSFYASMRPFVSGFSYQNYIDRDLTAWEHAYYGANYPRLRRVKRKYDPRNVFRFAQSVRPAA